MLYDKWWKAVPAVKEPVGDHPLCASQSTNKLKGEATWRCKECHGWDYRGKDGAYGVDAGKRVFAACAICHGADGATLNFGKPDKPEFVGSGLSLQDLVDLLGAATR